MAFKEVTSFREPFFLMEFYCWPLPSLSMVWAHDINWTT